MGVDVVQDPDWGDEHAFVGRDEEIRAADTPRSPPVGALPANPTEPADVWPPERKGLKRMLCKCDERVHEWFVEISARIGMPWFKPAHRREAQVSTEVGARRPIREVRHRRVHTGTPAVGASRFERITRHPCRDGRRDAPACRARQTGPKNGVIPLSHPVIRPLARRKLALTPDGNRSTSVGTAFVPRTSAPDILSTPLAGKTPRFAPDTTFFDSHTTPMMKDMTKLMTVMSALMSLIIALLFHTTKVMSVITALMIVIS